MKCLPLRRNKTWHDTVIFDLFIGTSGYDAVKHLPIFDNSFFFLAREEENLQDTAVLATTRLKQALTNEREASIRLHSEVDGLKV